VEQALRGFYANPAVFEQAAAASDSGYRDRVEAFVRALAGYGIDRSRIEIDEFTLFGHSAIAALVSQFIADNPGLPLPLERVTVIQYARAATFRQDLEETARRLTQYRDRMAHFARNFAIEVHVHVFFQGPRP
jgi:hypothetical protein